MIRHIHNVNTHNVAPRQAVRQAVKTSTETNPFRSVLDSTALTDTSTKTATAQQATTQITATVTKEAVVAKPVVPLTPPVFDQTATATNPDGSVTPLNWTQFADDATAQNIAAKLGGTVTTSTMDGYSSTQRSISVPGSPNLVNAGVAAQLFAQYGDKPGSLAWQVINRDLGRDPMST